MPYIVEAWDKPGTLEIRQKFRPPHLEYLDKNKTLLLACGARLNDDGSDAGGSLYIIDVDTREEAEGFLKSDPFYQAGLFERFSVTRWRKAYFAGERCL
jgi:uncharacterized protein YciI